MPNRSALSPSEFVRSSTHLETVEFVPEIHLHLAAEALALWTETEREIGRDDLAPPFWGFAWAGGQALARYILDHPELIAGRRVLDLASGSGLVAIAAAKSGAATVTATEIDEFAVAAISANAAANNVDVDAVLGDILNSDNNNFDVLLAGDIFYEKATAQRVMSFVEQVHGRGGTVLVGDPGRAYLPRERFEEVITYDVPVMAELEDTDRKRTTIWRPTDH